LQALSRVLAEIYLPTRGNNRKESSTRIHFKRIWRRKYVLENEFISWPESFTDLDYPGCPGYFSYAVNSGAGSSPVGGNAQL
jgi:hypothetical protein